MLYPRASGFEYREACGTPSSGRRLGKKVSAPLPHVEKPPDQAAPPRISPAVALGKLGSKKGGAAQAASLSPKRRLEIAKKAAKARWKGHKP